MRWLDNFGQNKTSICGYYCLKMVIRLNAAATSALETLTKRKKFIWPSCKISVLKMWTPKIMLIGNFLTAAAYYMLTFQLLLFWRRFQVGFFGPCIIFLHPSYGTLFSIACIVFQ